VLPPRRRVQPCTRRPCQGDCSLRPRVTHRTYVWSLAAHQSRDVFTILEIESSRAAVSKAVTVPVCVCFTVTANRGPVSLPAIHSHLEIVRGMWLGVRRTGHCWRPNAFLWSSAFPWGIHLLEFTFRNVVCVVATLWPPQGRVAWRPRCSTLHYMRWAVATSSAATRSPVCAHVCGGIHIRVRLSPCY
jgi:hypothetical protein